MSRLLLIIIVVLVAGASYVVVSNTKDMYKVLPIDVPETATPVHHVEKGNIQSTNFLDWHLYVSPNGNFQVMFPTLPQQAAKKIVDDKTKEPRDYDMYVSEKNDGTLFIITAITFPPNRDPKATEQLLTKAMTDMVESDPNNKLKNVKVNEFQNMKALDFTIESDKINIDGKAFMVGDTLYVLTSIGKNEAYNPKEFSFFTNSFEFMKHQPIAKPTKK